MTPPANEIVLSDKSRVACDGGLLGHPRIFLTLPKGGQVVCPYCSRSFVHVNAPEVRAAHPTAHSAP